MKNYTQKIEHNNKIEYYNDDGELHKTDGPACEYNNGDKYWCIEGKLHRIDGPAVEWDDGHKEWYINGKRLTKEQFNQHLKSIFSI